MSSVSGVPKVLRTRENPRAPELTSTSARRARTASSASETVAACSTSARLTTCPTSVRARASDTHGASRPMTSSHAMERSSDQPYAGWTCPSSPSGIQMSIAWPTISPVKPRGVTPMMVTGASLIVITRPMTPGSNANRRPQ